MTTPVVRPRLVWTGAAGMLVGFAVVGLGVAQASWWVSVAGALVVMVGAVGGWRGGITHDVHGRGDFELELEAAKEGERTGGVRPGQMLHDPAAEQRAVADAAAKKERLAAARHVSAPLRPAAATVLLFLAAWLLFGQFLMGYPYDEIGQNSEFRQIGFAILLALAGLYLRQVGPSRIATGAVLLCGILLVLSAALLPHHAPGSLITEWVVGGLVLACGAATIRD